MAGWIKAETSWQRDLEEESCLVCGSQEAEQENCLERRGEGPKCPRSHLRDPQMHLDGCFAGHLGWSPVSQANPVINWHNFHVRESSIIIIIIIIIFV